MGIIKLLPENLINQISAGEVIERPASVLKELVENAIDAGSNEIEIDFAKAGKEKILVNDNGSGMDSEDVLLCFERHATSKISKFDDLFKISTLGFRGEALPSIASVSETTILTSKDGKEGYKVEIIGGKVISFEPFIHQKGTTIIVKNLFYNTPARKKFLRSDGTEKKYLFKVFLNFALAFPNVFFKLKENGKSVQNYGISSSEEERFIQIYGDDLKDYIEIKEKNRDSIYFKLILLKENLPFPVPGIKQIFVNSRAVYERWLYNFLKEKHQKSSWILFLKVPPDMVDVNIHPSKEEVKFKEPSKIISLFDEIERKIFIPKSTSYSIQESKKENIFVQEALNIPSEIYNFRFISQISGTFLLYEEEKGLVIVDPHSAHERILFENMLEKKGRRQHLLYPEILELNIEEIEEYKENQNYLNDMGFEIEISGSKTLRINSTPDYFNIEEAKIFLKQFINSKKYKNIKEKIISSIACRKSVWFSKIFNAPEALKLYYDLKNCKEPNFCPHGRPTFIKYNEEKLLKLFERPTHRKFDS